LLLSFVAPRARGGQLVTSMDFRDDLALRPATQEPLSRLAGRIRTRTASVAVVGLGYVGLPLLIGAANVGYRVIGMEADIEKVRDLRAGRSYVGDVSDSDVQSVEDGEFSTDPAALERADVVLICVPTPLTDLSPDLSLVRLAAEQIGQHLRPGVLVVLESTTYPGTTEDLIRPIIEARSGLRAGVDFALGYSPERIDPGQDEHTLENTPKVVSGVTDRCRELASSFYSSLVREVVTTASPREAEMAKLIENTFRQVNIALVNELAVMAKELNVDVWDALSAASTKPFGYMPFWPGPGVGGHCIAIDPSYLSWKVGQQLGYRTGFIEHANEVNNRMPDYVVNRIGDVLNDVGKPIKGSRILAMGLTYKPGVDDLRGSPALQVVERLAARGGTIAYHDPFVTSLSVGARSLESVPLTEELLAAQDCVALLTIHPDFDIRWLVRHSRIVFDARGATTGIDAPNVVRL
jgi:UDP-N-acetyl-D-glucosamine dehydrogenase